MRLESKILVSVIVTIYQDEKYINNCVESIIRQDYSSIEIILVDDGSKDKGGIIADDLAKIDERIIVIHQENKGVSAARNTGIRRATGDYIMFVDGDDWVDKDYVSTALSIVLLNDCACGFISVQSDRLLNDETMSIDSIDAIRSIYLREIAPSVCNKIFQRKFVVRNEIKFSNEICYGEDMLFLISILSKLKSVAVGKSPKYHITKNMTSVTRGFKAKIALNNFKSLDLQGRIVTDYNIDVVDKWRYYVYWYNRYILESIVCSRKIKQERKLFNKCIRNMRRHIGIVFICSLGIKEVLIWMLFFAFPRCMSYLNILKHKVGDYDTVYI